MLLLLLPSPNADAAATEVEVGTGEFRRLFVAAADIVAVAVLVESRCDVSIESLYCLDRMLVNCF